MANADHLHSSAHLAQGWSPTFLAVVANEHDLFSTNTNHRHFQHKHGLLPDVQFLVKVVSLDAQSLSHKNPFVYYAPKQSQPYVCLLRPSWNARSPGMKYGWTGGKEEGEEPAGGFEIHKDSAD